MDKPGLRDALPQPRQSDTRNDPFWSSLDSSLSAAAAATPQPSEPVAKRDLDVGLGDVARGVGAGALELGGGIGELARQASNFGKENAGKQGGDYLEQARANMANKLSPVLDAVAGAGDLAQGGAESLTEGMSADAKEALGRRLVDETPEGRLTLGDGAGDIDVWAMKMAQGVGSMLPTLAAGGVTGLAAKVSIGRAVTASMIKRGATQEVAEAVAAKAVSKIATGASVTTGVTGSVGSAGVNTRDTVLGMSFDELAGSDTFRQAFTRIDQDQQTAHLSDEEKLGLAREETANLASRATMSDAKVWGAAAMGSMMGDAMLFKMLAGKAAAGGVLKAAGKGAVGEWGGETLEEGVQQYAVNESLNEVAAADIDPMKGVMSSAIEGGLIGMGAGGAVGAVGGARGGKHASQEDGVGTDPVAEPSAPVTEGAAGPAVDPNFASVPLEEGEQAPSASQAEGELNPLGPSASQFDELRDVPAYLRQDDTADRYKGMAADSEVQRALAGEFGQTVQELVASQMKAGDQGKSLYERAQAGELGLDPFAGNKSAQQVAMENQRLALPLKDVIFAGDANAKPKGEAVAAPGDHDDQQAGPGPQFRGGERTRWQSGQEGDVLPPEASSTKPAGELPGAVIEGEAREVGNELPHRNVVYGNDLRAEQQRAADLARRERELNNQPLQIGQSETIFAGGTPGADPRNSAYTPPRLSRDQVDTSMGEQSTRDPRSPVAQSIEQAGSATDSVFGPLKSLRITRKGKPFATEKEAAMASRKGQEMPVPLNGGGFGVAEIAEVEQVKAAATTQSSAPQLDDISVTNPNQPSDQPAASVSAETVPAPSATAGEASQLAPAIDTGYREVIPVKQPKTEVSNEPVTPVPAISSEGQRDQPGAGEPAAAGAGPAVAGLTDRAGSGDRADLAAPAPVPDGQQQDDPTLTAPATDAGAAVSGRIGEEELRDRDLLKEHGGRWKYRSAVGAGWFTANTKEAAIERAEEAYRKAVSKGEPVPTRDERFAQSETMRQGQGVNPPPPRTLDTDGRASDGKPINGGDTFATSSGRTTTPYPKQKGEKYASQWLINNATEEARARGDNFNAPIFSATTTMKNGSLTTADRDGMLSYLFGQQPAVLPPITRPLTAPAKAKTESKPAAKEKTTEQPITGQAADNFAGNKLFTADAVAAARARMKAKLGRLNSGFDPELLMDGIIITGAYIESGVRNFNQYAKAMVGDLGRGVKPYLLSFWEGSRAYPGLDTAGMSSVDESAKAYAAWMAGDFDKVTEGVADNDENTSAPQRAPATANKPADNDKPAGPLTGKDGSPKWFSTQAKAQEFLTKNGLDQQYQPKQVDKQWQLHPKGEQTSGQANETNSDTRAGQGKPKAKAKTVRGQLRDRLYLDLLSGKAIGNNNDLKNIAAQLLGIKPADVTTLQLKEAQEAYEVAAARVRREEIQKRLNTHQGQRAAFDYAVNEYGAQPNLDVRTAQSSNFQAYSTPAPLALLANLAAGVSGSTTVYEPTAGNGLLLLTADPANTFANELDADRADSLAWSGFDVTVLDATNNPFEGAVNQKVDAVVANPPFGKYRDGDGKPVKYEFLDQQGRDHAFGEIDHVIAKHALDAMKHDGKAALILGAPKESGVYTGNNKAFLNWLYSNYSVVSHIEVDGDLYKGQGAGWPVQLIVVHGRAPNGTGKFAPIAGQVKLLDSWSSIYDAIKPSFVDTDGAAYHHRKGQGNVLPPYRPASDPTQSEQSDQNRPGVDATGVGPGTAQGDDHLPSGFRPVTGSGFSVTTEGNKPGRNSGKSGLGKPKNRPAAKPEGAEGVPQDQPVVLFAGSGVAGEGEFQPKEIPTQVDRANDFQARYHTASNGFNDAVLTPINMASYNQIALQSIQDRHGSVDGFVAQRLGYNTPAALHDAFMGLQVDAVAQAIDNIERGRAIIIGDQTGVGKGRQAAGVIRYAIQQGKIPVFITQKANLFTDMYDDLGDIGVTGFKPLIVNQDNGFVSKGGEKLFNHGPNDRKKLLDTLRTTGRLPEGYGGLFLTYSQISSDQQGEKTKLLSSIASNALFVMDESHSASGNSGVGESFQALVDEAWGVTYLSATYAKRPDNMALYTRTDLGLAVENKERLTGVISDGGISMQTYIASKLSEAGQMLRRERSFEGISINNHVVEDKSGAIEKQFDQTTEVMRATQSLSQYWADYVKKHLALAIQQQSGMDTAVGGNKADTAVKVTLFSSAIHNHIAQLTLALKAKDIAKMAVEAIKQGKRPVIALDNTLEAALDEYMEKNMLSVGGRAGDFKYNSLLKSMADNALVYTVKKPGQQKGDKTYADPYELGDPVLIELYENVMQLIDGLDMDLQASPIDTIRNEIRKAGYSVAEITGRNKIVDYGDGNTIKNRPANEKDRRAVVDRFNAGLLDVVIINQAGSTGLSIHASEKFKDQRPRHMIVAQPSLDINVFMQMLGRINRTGQVALPTYDVAWLDLPSEMRPAAVLARKMGSLNANTSGSTESATSVDSVDLLNEYGDEVVRQYVIANATMLSAYSSRLVVLPDDDKASHFLGRLAVMPVAMQRSVLDELERDYKQLIEYLDATGQNELNLKEVDLDAEPVEQMMMSPARADAGVFGDPVYLTKTDVKAQGKAPKWEEVQEELAKGSQSDIDNQIKAMQAQTEYRDRLNERLKKREAEVEQQRKSGKEVKNEALLEVADAKMALADYDSAARGLAADFGVGGKFSHGSALRVKIGESETAVTGIVVGVEHQHKTGNPLSPSKWRIKLMVADRVRTLPVTLLRANSGVIEGVRHDTQANLKAIFDRAADMPSRETRYIMTGNLLEAQSRSTKRGRIVPFTTQDGRVLQGLVMPRTFDPGTDVQQVANINHRQAFMWLSNTTDRVAASLGLKTVDGEVVLRRERWGNDYALEMPKAVSKGKKYWGNPKMEAIIGEQAVKGNGKLTIKLTPQQAQDVAVVMSEISPLGIYNQAQIVDYNKMTGKSVPTFSKDGIKFSKQAVKHGSKPTKAMTASEVEMVLTGWLKRYQGAGNIKVAVHATQAEMERALGIDPQPGLVRRAAFDDDTTTLHIAADTISDPKRLNEILRHEVLAHYGLANVLGDGEYTKLMSRLIASQKDPSMKPVWDWVNTHYADEDIGTKAEEVVAHLAELEQGAWGRGWDRVVAWVTRALRAVGFVPDGITAAETRSLIEGLGKKLQRSGPDNGGQDGGHKFSQESEQSTKMSQESLGETIEVDGRLRPTTNSSGQPIHPTEDGIRAFWRWFGDSKVVDESGRPKVMFHGTTEDFTEFDEIYGGIYFAEDPSVSEFFATAATGERYGAKRFYLKAENIFDPTNDDAKETLDKVERDYDNETDYKDDDGEYMPLSSWVSSGYLFKLGRNVQNEVMESLSAEGFDGVRYTDASPATGDSISFVVFDPSKIKSAEHEFSGGPNKPSGARFSQTNTAAADAAMEKLNLGPKPDIIDKTKASLNKLRQVDRGVVSSWIDRVIKKANTEVLDALAPIKYAEEAAGITDAADSGYVAARMATGAASTMQATMLYGLPEWNDGVIQRKAGTGEKDALLGIFADLGADLHNWLGWMAGHRAELLMAQGRENLLDANDIAALKGQGKGKEAKFLDAKARWNRLNAATLDLAQEAGLFTKEARAEFESEWYIPFFRESDDGDVIAPFKTKGIANQNSGIKKLKGGEANTNDLLENIFTSTSKLIDASMKNMAAQKTVWNLADTGIIEVIPKPNKMDYQALANGKDRIMVKLEGEDYMIRVEDPDLYRAMTFFDRKPFSAMVNVAAKAKRLLTAGVTASPEFMLRNFLRDSLSSWAISKDGFRPVIDSIKGVKKTLAMDGSTIDVMFSGASFLGGYVNGNDPEAMADTVRKSLRRKGMTPEQIARYEKSIIRNAAQAKGVVANVWEKYNRYGEAFENANREAVYAAAIKAGKSHAQAAFESKDLMDFSMLGASRTMQVMTQLLPFFNARVQGLGKLSRELRDNPREIAKRAGMITAASLALLAANWDDERYEELPDWDKDANWHFFVGDQHFRIPKPFEIGVLFGTIPERMVRALGDKDTGAQFGKAVARAVGETFALNPTPQIVKPLVESYFNYDAFRGIPIENAQDLAVKVEARYNEQTSLMMRELGEATGMSPKKLEHLLIGYTGTIGGYVMATADGLIRAAQPGESASWRADEIPLVKAVYRGTGPAKSTQHMEEFYRMLNEVNQLKRTVDQYRSEGLTDKANELLEEQGGILKSRRSLSRTQQQVRVVRNRIELIQRDRTLTAEEKRRRIDEMLARRNDLVYQAVNKNKANWE